MSRDELKKKWIFPLLCTKKRKEKTTPSCSSVKKNCIVGKFSDLYSPLDN